MEAPVRFETDTGEILRPAAAGELGPKSVTDAEEPCPACEGSSERVTPMHGSRGSRGSGEPISVDVCCRCGHEEGEGGW
jgi:hypothetical protein